MFDGPSFAQGTVVGSGDVRAVSYGDDKGLFVEFRKEPFYNEFQSKERGRPVYDEKVMVKIYVPGDKTKVVDRLAVLDPEMANGIPTDDKRWAQQWDAYQRGVTALQSGTPLAEWPQMTKSQIIEFNAINIHTVEQLAEVPDGLLENLGHGARSMRDGAKAWLVRAGDDAHANKQDAQIAELRAQIEALKASPPEEKRGPGRPPINREEAA